MQKVNFINKTKLSNKDLFERLIRILAIQFKERGSSVYAKIFETLELLPDEQHFDFFEAYEKLADSLFEGNEHFRSYLDEFYCNQLKGNNYEILTTKELEWYSEISADRLRNDLKTKSNIIYVSDGLQIALTEMKNVSSLPGFYKTNKNFEFNVLVRSDIELFIAYIHLSLIESQLGIPSNIYQIEGDTKSPDRLIVVEYIGKQTRSYEVQLNGVLAYKKAA